MRALARIDGRRGGHHYVRGSALTYRAKLEALFLASPQVSVEDAALKTGASRNVAATVKRRLKEAGRI